MRKFDPRVKLVSILLTTSLALIFREALYIFPLAIISISLCHILGGSLIALFSRTKKIIPLLLGVSLIQLIFTRNGTVLVEIGSFSLIYVEGLEKCLCMALRFIIIFTSAGVMANENSRYVIAALTKAKVPYIFSFMMMISIRFIPFFADSFSDALVAIQLRGIELERLKIGKKVRIYGHILLPVVADAIVKSQELALAMEARGFGALPRRTSYLDPVLSPRDWLMMGVLLASFALGLGAYYI